ncbi:hypothetical protein [Primorskyibacter sp. S87]|uniref:hypothetical protein n=1 Tax=Primorskyibacter sp. S87 TaxID=3415126 RepID=UPI003C7EC945
MNGTDIARGGRTVGHVGDLSPVEIEAVRALRGWDQRGSDDEPERSAGEACLSQICQACMSHGRRPFVRHGVTCACLGADEACFAAMVHSASMGDREDATLFAALLVRPDMAPYLAGLAEQFGLALRRDQVMRDRAASFASAGAGSMRPALLH